MLVSNDSIMFLGSNRTSQTVNNIMNSSGRRWCWSLENLKKAGLTCKEKSYKRRAKE